MIWLLAHTIPLAGHLGKAKTVNQILQRFYWPTIYQNVAKFCRSCESCQLAAGRKPARAPLIPLPIITQHFSRMAMDIVGPLPRTRHGNRYALVVCNYATQYPEAVALRSIEFYFPLADRALQDASHSANLHHSIPSWIGQKI